MGSDELQQLHQRFEWHYPEDNIQSIVGWALDEFRDMQVSVIGRIMIKFNVLKDCEGFCFPSSAVTFLLLQTASAAAANGSATKVCKLKQAQLAHLHLIAT